MDKLDESNCLAKLRSPAFSPKWGEERTALGYQNESVVPLCHGHVLFCCHQAINATECWQARKARKERLKEGGPVVALRTGPCGLYLRKAESARPVVECRNGPELEDRIK